MRLRNQDPDPAVRPVAMGGDTGPDHTELRERGAALLAAADDAIARALSRNSAEFLAQNRQAGGE
jgi:hypothetical protein